MFSNKIDSFWRLSLLNDILNKEDALAKKNYVFSVTKNTKFITLNWKVEVALILMTLMEYLILINLVIIKKILIIAI